MSKGTTVEVMPDIPDTDEYKKDSKKTKKYVLKALRSQRNESKTEFAGNYQGPLYAPHPDLVNEVAPPGKKYERMVKHIKKNYPKDKEGIAYATAWKHKNKDK